MSSFCANYHINSHIFAHCPNVKCKYCHKYSHILKNCPIRPPRSLDNSTDPISLSKIDSPCIATASLVNEQPSISINSLQNLMQQVISLKSSALAVFSGNSWLLDSVCCNHMTSNISLMPSSSPASSLPPIHTANGNCMSISHVGTVITPTLNLPNSYHVPNLTFNLASVGQLCDFGLIFPFSSNGCQVQDPHTG